MNFNELKQWARKYGYDILKEKGTETCLWTLVNDPKISGIADSYSECARQIYNDITEGIWVEYQEQYKKEKKEVRFE